MTDKNSFDHWSELANQVGAIPPAAEGKASETPSPPAEAETSVVAASAKAPDVEIVPRKVRAYRPKSGWDDLAHEFDLPQAAGAESPHVEEEKEEAEPPRGEEGTVWCGAEKFDALFDDSSSGEKDTSAVKLGEEQAFAAAIAAASQELEKDQLDERKKSGRRRKKRKRRPDQAEKNKADVDERLDEQADLDRDEELDELAEEVGGFAAGLYETEKPSRAEMRAEMRAEKREEETEEGEQRRGRHRRKRGSRRKKESPQEAADESRPEEDDEDVHREEQDEDDLEEDSKMFSHRGIPTWDEAMEYIISTNLEKRSKKSSGGSQQRPRGGRGRGDRDRANSRKRPE